MSYAEAAKSSGPVGAEPIPKPAELETTTDPNGSVQTIDGKEFEKKRKQAAEEVKRVAAEAAQASKEHAEEIRGELEGLEDESKAVLQQYYEYAKKQLSSLYSGLSSTFRENADYAASKAGYAANEIQNPVVVGQLAVVAGGAAASYYVWQERAHIRTDNRYVVAVHAGLITALVLADAYVYQKLYPKYKKY